jgi:hypothetical protein
MPQAAWRGRVGWLAAFVLANATYWLLGLAYFVDRALLGLDLMVALLLWRGHRWLGVTALLLAWVVDALVSRAMAWYFLHPVDFLRSAQHAGQLDWTAMVSWSWAWVALLFAAAFAGIFWLMNVPQQWRWRDVLLFGLPLIALDAALGASMLRSADHGRAPVNVAGSATANLMSILATPVSRASLRRLPAQERPLEELDIGRWALGHPDGHVVIVLVESLGVARDAALRAWIDRQLVDGRVDDRFDVRRFEAPFHGATTAAELRVLCGLKGPHTAMTAEEGARHCLPHSLAATGWSTAGFHGFSGHMFDRTTWWPMTGLQARTFAEDLPAAWPRCGGAFRGACDADVIMEAARHAARPRSFTYVLTLNSHLPLAANAVHAAPDQAPPCASLAVEVCELAGAHGVALRAIRDHLLAALPAPALVVVMGDHAPPFQAKAPRAAFDAERVPAWAFSSGGSVRGAM